MLNNSIAAGVSKSTYSGHFGYLLSRSHESTGLNKKYR